MKKKPVHQQYSDLANVVDERTASHNLIGDTARWWLYAPVGRTDLKRIMMKVPTWLQKPKNNKQWHPFPSPNVTITKVIRKQHKWLFDWTEQVELWRFPNTQNSNPPWTQWRGGTIYCVAVFIMTMKILQYSPAVTMFQMYAHVLVIKSKGPPLQATF